MNSNTDTFSASSHNISAPNLEDFAEPPARITVCRDGELDLSFEGWRLGEGTTRWNNGRREVVRIYATKGGAIVVHRCRATQWEKERDIHDAWIVRTIEGLHGALREDTYNASLGEASKEALEEACKNYAPLTGQDVEEVA